MASADASVSHHGRKGKKKKKKEDAEKKIPKIFSYLFHRGGLEEKSITPDPDGWVIVDDILDKEMYSDYIEDDVLEALSDSKGFELKVSPDTGTLLVRPVLNLTVNAGSEQLLKSPEAAAQQSGETEETGAVDKSKISSKRSRRKKPERDHDEKAEAKVPSYKEHYTVSPPAGHTDTKYHRPGGQGNDVFISKTLSWLLRHGAEKAGFRLQEGGFLYVEDVLQLPKFRGRVTDEDIKRVVDTNQKQRFFMEPHPENGKLRIRANQGHSVRVEGLDFTPVTSAADYPMVVHGTYTKNWPSIKQQGLKRMNRTHIHFAPGEPKESGVVSGMRSSCDVLIFIDLASALSDGYEFVISANNVILCCGDATGCLPPKYFKEVLDRRTRKEIKTVLSEDSGESY